MHKKLCLTMIVKNESKIIERLFDSVVGLIDTYCICDTGSTDNTKEIIRAYFDKKGINGHVIEEPFQNFEYNRTHVIHSAMDLGIADYLLLLDADMKLRKHPDLKIQDVLNAGFDILHIFQGAEHFSYHNTRIIRCDKRIKYIGVTHEYVSFPDGMKKTLIPKEVLFIDDIGDGGSKQNKYERDIDLLSKRVEEEDGDVRSWFYLANSYFDLGKNAEALRAYQKRVDLGGWDQEIFYSHYRMGLIYQRLHNEPLFVFQMLKAYQACPDRLENIYKLVNYYREKSNCVMAKGFFNFADVNKPRSTENFLFTEDHVYKFLFDYEYTIIAFYLGERQFSPSFMNVFNKCPDMNILMNVMTNLKFYDLAQSFLDCPDKKHIIITKKCILEWRKRLFQNCTTSSLSMVALSPDKILVNQRIVNYYVTQTGGYEFEHNVIVTWNEPLYLKRENEDKKWSSSNKNSPNLIVMDGEDEFPEHRINGAEDVRIYQSVVDKKIYYLGVNWFGENNIGIIHGEYDYENRKMSRPVRLTHDHVENVEKNWVHFPYRGKDCLIYKWHPIEVFRLQPPFDQKLPKIKEVPTPNIFRFARGSTNGVIDPVTQDIWFVVHLVSYEQPRVYYHMLVALDELTLSVKRYSAPFRFNMQTPIQYSIGLCFPSDEEVLISYSEWDRTSNIMSFPREHLYNLMTFS